MASSYSLRWQGKLVVGRLVEATKAAVDEVLSECVIAAKQYVPVRTATLQGSIMAKPAKASGGGVSAQWGSFDVNYSIYVELGTRYMSARPYLRPAADRFYPHLEATIREKAGLIA